MSGAVPKTFRTAVTLLIAVSIPVVPFLLFGDWMELAAERWVTSETGTVRVALLVVVLLSSDIFLPIPSSVVSTYAGQALGLFGGALASWVGMTVGAALGYALAARFGPALARRFSKDDALQQAEALRGASASWLLVLTRALPILAEAAVLVCGLHRIGWHRFLPPAALANLGIALAYAALGEYSANYGWLPMALALAAALPLVVSLMARQRYTA